MVASNVLIIPESPLVVVSKPPKKTKDTRERLYITEFELEETLKACNQFSRHSVRNRTLILTMYTHGLRTCEAIALRWNLINFQTGNIHVQRAKNGNDSIQPIRGREMRLLRQLKREYPESPFVFNTERLSPLSSRTVRDIVAKAGKYANLLIKLRPHMLRHACGFYLANKLEGDTRVIQDYLGHVNISHTVTYTKLSSKKFEGLWRD